MPVAYGTFELPVYDIATCTSLFLSQGRGGLGSIWVWASGNGGRNSDSCAADGYVSSIYTVAVGSATPQGNKAYYDEACSGKMAVTYSYNSNGYTQMVL